MFITSIFDWIISNYGWNGEGRSWLYQWNWRLKWSVWSNGSTQWWVLILIYL